MYYIMTKIEINLVFVMKDYKLKCKRLVDYRFLDVVLVSKLLKYFDVKLKVELKETINFASEVDCVTQLEMGFHKVNDI